MYKTVSETAVLEILEHITLAMDEPKIPKTRFRTFLDFVLLWGAIVPYLIGLLLAIPFFLNLQNEVYAGYLQCVKDIVVVMLGIAIVCVLVYLIGTTTVESKVALKIFKRPHAPIVGNARMTALGDINLYKIFLVQRVVDLKYTQIQLKAEYEYFGKRVGALVGVLANVGIVPALLAYVVIFLKLGSEVPALIKGFVYIAPVFYFMAMIELPIRSKIVRYVALLDMAIEQKASDAAKIKSEPVTRGRLMGMTNGH